MLNIMYYERDRYPFGIMSDCMLGFYLIISR